MPDEITITEQPTGSVDEQNQAAVEELRASSCGAPEGR